MFQMDERDNSWTAAIGQKQLSGHKRPFPGGGFRPKGAFGYDIKPSRRAYKVGCDSLSLHEALSMHHDSLGLNT